MEGANETRRKKGEEESMKTLIALNNPDLKTMLFQPWVMEKLQSVTQMDWLEDYGDFAKRLPDYDACITTWGSPKITKEILALCPRLRFIGHAAGTVVPYIDEAFFEKNIVVTNANYALSRATAEGAVAMMAAGAYRLNTYAEEMARGLWANNDRETVLGLTGQTIGLIGFGDICREVIRLLAPYRPNILLCSSHCSAQEAETLGVTICDLDTLLKESRIISLHNTLTSRTRGMIGDREFSIIREGCLFLNTARAPIVDEKALLKALESGKIHAILDVYDEEPLPMDHPLRKQKNAWMLPHIAAYSHYWKTRLALCVAEDMERWVRGEPLRGQITKARFQRLTPA